MSDGASFDRSIRRFYPNSGGAVAGGAASLVRRAPAHRRRPPHHRRRRGPGAGAPRPRPGHRRGRAVRRQRQHGQGGPRGRRRPPGAGRAALLLVALWARLVQRGQVRPVMWASLALSLAGRALVAEVWRDARLDAVGVGAAAGAAVCLATFLLVGRRIGGALDPLAVNVWTFAFAAAFWLAVEPVWAVDRTTLGRSTSLLGALD